MVQTVSPSAASMAASPLEVAVFIDTDVGTRLAVAVPPHSAAGTLKREVERVHFNCFPTIGEIKVDGFMVEQNSKFYHLSDTMLTKLTSQVEAVQFLHVKARPLNEYLEPRLPENADCFAILNNVTYPSGKRGYSSSACKSKIIIDDKEHTRKRFKTKNLSARLVCRSNLAWNTKRKRKRTNKYQLLEHVEKNSNTDSPIKDSDNPNGSIDTPSYHCIQNDEVRTTKQWYSNSTLVEAAAMSELSTEVMSVSSIIKRYFPSHGEVSSIPNRSSHGIARSPPEEYLKKKKNMERSPSLLPLKQCSQKLGKRVVMASYNLGISPKRPEISLCNSRGKKLQELMGLAKSSCFEISDSED